MAQAAPTPRARKTAAKTADEAAMTATATAKPRRRSADAPSNRSTGSLHPSNPSPDVRPSTYATRPRCTTCFRALFST